MINRPTMLWNLTKCKCSFICDLQNNLAVDYQISFGRMRKEPSHIWHGWTALNLNQFEETKTGTQQSSHKQCGHFKELQQGNVNAAQLPVVGIQRKKQLSSPETNIDGESNNNPSSGHPQKKKMERVHQESLQSLGYCIISGKMPVTDQKHFILISRFAELFPVLLMCVESSS